MNHVVLLDAEEAHRLASDLGAILIDCVEGGSSVFFRDTITTEEATRFFEEVAASVARGDSFLLGAYDGETLRGSVQVILATPPNQTHRAELSKLLVRRNARWRGLGRALVLAAEDESRKRGKTLLSLDTTVGSLAERLFAGMDYRRLGIIPGYAVNPNGLLNDAIFFWKPL